MRKNRDLTVTDFSCIILKTSSKRIVSTLMD